MTDLRELNKQTVKDSYPLTNIQEILHSLKGATVFSALDACGAFKAVRIKLGSHACTAFISPFGTFQYIRMPFRLANAGSVYRRMLDMAMKDVDRDFWTSYLDDILRTLDTLQTFGTGGTSTCGRRSRYKPAR